MRCRTSSKGLDAILVSEITNLAPYQIIPTTSPDLKNAPPDADFSLSSQTVAPRSLRVKADVIDLPNVTGWAVAVDGETQRPSVLVTSGKHDNSGSEIALNRYYYASAAMLRFLYFAGCKRLRVTFAH